VDVPSAKEHRANLSHLIGQHLAGISGIRIVLNESVSTETDERRRFVFDRPALGQYRVRLETRELRKH